MKQITKISIALALIITLASCQSSKSGCYDFSQSNQKMSQKSTNYSKANIVFTDAISNP